MITIKNFLSTALNWRFIAGALASLAIFAVVKITGVNYGENAMALIFLLFILIFLLRGRKGVSVFVFGALTAIAVIILLYYIVLSYRSFNDIRQWDFLCFYVWGKLGVSGLNFYDPANLASVFSGLVIPVEVDNSFAATINSGFIYPPMTMLMIAPLGLMNFSTAVLVWKLFVLFFLVVDLFLLAKIFRTHEREDVSIVIILLLVLLLPGTYSTIFFSQTNFLLLFFLLLSLNYISSWKSGVFLALAVMVKPIAAIWCLYLLLAKRWGAVLALVVTGLFMALLSGIIFGFDNIISYFVTPPTANLPEWVYSERINQSMFAVIARFVERRGLEFSFNDISLTVIIISLVLTVLTALASLRMSGRSPRLAFLIFIPLSLYIYPGTLSYYAVLLLPVFLEILCLTESRKFRAFIALILFLFLSRTLLLSVVSISILAVMLIQFYIKPGWQKLSYDEFPVAG